eukprot:3789846-Amphidinium_carterae.1
MEQEILESRISHLEGTVQDWEESWHLQASRDDAAHRLIPEDEDVKHEVDPWHLWLSTRDEQPQEAQKGFQRDLLTGATGEIQP